MRVIINVLIVAAICGCALVKKHDRPEPVPEHAVWVGGADSGVWIDCEMVFKEPVSTYRCVIFSDPSGNVEAQGMWLLASVDPEAKDEKARLKLLEGPFHELSFCWFDGESVGLGGFKMLIPDGEIDFPFPDGGGKRVSFDHGKRNGEEIEY